MKNIIDELILQNSLFMESIKYGDTYQNILYESNKTYEKLLKTLNKEQAKLLEELINSHTSLEAEGNDCNFIAGFKAAVKLIIECFNNDCSPYGG